MRELDTSEGWCCDGRTFAEHAHTDGKCCQQKGMNIEDLPAKAREAACARLDHEEREKAS